MTGNPLAALATPRGILWLALLLGTALGNSAPGREIYVAPKGAPQGDGSRQRPIDLGTALSEKGPAAPGDTIYLKAGQYDGPIGKTDEGVPRRIPFAPRISGQPCRPIVVAPEPGAAAHINGTLALGEIEHVHFVGLEIGDLEWDPLRRKHVNETAVNTGGAGLKVVNCNIFGGAMGMGLWRPAVDLEVYGCLIHDFGYYSDTLRGSGHAAYIQNDRGTKRFEHNVAYRGCGWNYDLYTQGGEVKGIDLIENIGYLASWHKPGQVGFNFGLTGFKPAERIRFIGNVGYHSRAAEQRWRSNMRLMASKPEAFHRDAVVKDNYVMGTFRALVLGRWQDIEVTGNTFWATDFLTEISSAPSGSGIPENPPRPDPKGYRVDRNTYFDNGKPRPFVYSARENPHDEETLSFAQWQAQGLDKHSRMLPGKDGRPTGTKVFVFPNKIVKGRAHVAVFNWDRLDRIEVDLSKVLTAGQKYLVYNCLDVKQTLARAKPALRGTYAGGPIRFPAMKDPSSPDFDAFLLLPE
jgi:hypothetical protein